MHAYMVIPGKEEPVEVVSFERLPCGNFRVLLRSEFHDYARVVTAKGLAAIRHEAIKVVTA